MIDYVKGTLETIDTQYVVVDHHGLGYQIFCPNPYIYQHEVHKDIQIFTHHYVREDQIRLFGFPTRKDRALFEKLLNVSGIGPKGALAICASGQPEHVVAAIEQEDEALLTRFPGVGKKTARQIILDLKGKLTDFAGEGVLSAEPTLFAPYEEPKTDALEEAFEALRALGYVEKELKKVRPKLEEETLEIDGYIKKALQLLLKR
ncbi:Holliday junction branch migration protein RuvA [Alkalicoccobacillus plakortidis]|uniref:Holliday junction branch migration complex subunit RuvA n=1 Tax=Alkalicoccobacillus plakortidis TaxID=444060 RepID=A0ABT0XL13_9BACI|nr:Holliday junction branch migration protein RuvA [Alkalicoccobacillus plakortidis]MCM2676595.1 Holliday junction branch migration protein RuvA [Alkalicoccobacillus plakortidis]